MVTVKGFQDGNRYVIVLEGIENVKIENVVKDIITKTIDNATFEQASPADAAPVPEQPIPQITIPEVFEEGPYEGLKPEEVVKEGQAAISYLVSFKKENPQNPLSKEIERSLIMLYKEKFSKTDSEAYSKKLSPTQLSTFFKTFENVVSQEMINEIKKNFNKEFDYNSFESESDIRSCVRKVVIMIQNYT